MRLLLRWSILLSLLGAVACGGGGGGFSSDGGVSGTGISALTGNVAAIDGDERGVAGILVRIDGDDATTTTDAAGFFVLRGAIDGARTLIFERPGDGVSARVDVRVPAGGTLELTDVVLDAGSGEARPARRIVEFRARVDAVDCLASALFVVSRFDAERLIFAVVLERMMLRDAGGMPARCEDLAPGRAVDVTGLVESDGRIADGTLVFAADEPTPTPTRAAATRTPARATATAAAPTAVATPSGPRSPDGSATATRAPVLPTARPGEPARPTTTATRVPQPTATPTGVRPSPTPTRGR